VSTRKALDALLGAAVDAGAVPGVVAMVCDGYGVLYEGAFGSRAPGPAQPMTVQTVFWIASMTKALTSAAALQLIEQGRAHLDAPASDLLPELAQVRVLEGFDESGAPCTRAPSRPVTLRHLLTHTSGFGYEYWSPAYRQYRKCLSIPGIGTCRNQALQLPLLADPGERWQYGISIDWLGKWVEAASGEKLGAYLQRALLGPLLMRDTAYRISPAMRARLAAVYQRAPDGGLRATTMESPQDPEFEPGGGGLYGTAGDYCRFLQMILNRGQMPAGTPLQKGRHQGRQVLAAETVAMMTVNQIGQLRVSALRTAMPSVSSDFEFFPDVESGFGFGFQINLQQTATGLTPGSLMWAGIANTYYWVDPSRNIAAVLLTQVMPFGDPRALALLRAFQTQVCACWPAGAH